MSIGLNKVQLLFLRSGESCAGNEDSITQTRAEGAWDESATVCLLRVCSHNALCYLVSCATVTSFPYFLPLFFFFFF